MLANGYQSSRVCEALYTQCEDKMDQLQILRLPSMAKFNVGFTQCNNSFNFECVGPSKSSYEHRMTKVCFTFSLMNNDVLFILHYQVFPFFFLYQRLEEIIIMIYSLISNHDRWFSEIFHFPMLTCFYWRN